MTAIEMYKGLLHGVKKNDTAVISPAKANLILNDAQTKFIDNNKRIIDQDSSLMSIFAPLRVVTDSIFEYNSVPLVPIVSSSIYFPVIHDYDTAINGVIYPALLKYERLYLTVKYLNDKCHGNNSVKTNCVPLPSDNENVVLNSVFRKPSDKKTYYRLLGNQMKVFVPQGSTPESIEIEYIKVPNPIDVINQVDCELSEEGQKEIIRIAIALELEREQSQRQQTFK